MDPCVFRTGVITWACGVRRHLRGISVFPALISLIPQILNASKTVLTDEGLALKELRIPVGMYGDALMQVFRKTPCALREAAWQVQSLQVCNETTVWTCVECIGSSSFPELRQTMAAQKRVIPSLLAQDDRLIFRRP